MPSRLPKRQKRRYRLFPFKGGSTFEAFLLCWYLIGMKLQGAITLEVSLAAALILLNHRFADGASIMLTMQGALLICHGVYAGLINQFWV